MGTYAKKRYYGCDCHIYSFDPSVERLDVTIGKPGRLEKLSKINGEPAANEEVSAKINGGFFNFDGSSEHLGTYVDSGLYYTPADAMYPTLIYWKNNLLTIEPNPDQSRLAYYQGNANFAIGVPWTLVIDGKINYTWPKEKLDAIFGHTTSKQPRTLLGQKEDKTILFVVVDGRRLFSPGMTMPTTAQLMLDLGCNIAVNLDGGGSSEMIVNDMIRNKPSDKGERSIGSAVVAYRKTGSANTTPTPDGALTATTTAALNLRTGPSTSYKVILTLSKGAKVTINEKLSNGWYNVTWSSYTGYVSGSYLMVNEVENTKPNYPTGYVSTSAGLNIRTGPGVEYTKVGTLTPSAIVTIYETKNNWFRIGVDKWVSAAYITRY